MSNLMGRLASGGRLVCDGGMGSLLIARGLPTGVCPEQWNIDRPEVLEEIARLYSEAGADILETNSFGGTPLKLAQYDLDRQTEEVNARAVKVTRSGAGDGKLIAGSVGPTGSMLKPYGDVDPETIREAFERQIRALIAERVDLLIVETITDLHEATLAILAARKLSATIPIAATMTFDATPRGFFTVMGVTVEQAISGLTAAGADIIGSNCGNGIDNMVAIAEEFRRHTDQPLLIQSNAGMPSLVEGKLTYSETPAYMAERAARLIEIGVNIIGGCCGTTPEHIAALRAAVDRQTA